ncbi:HTH-type transcriptional regulator BetI [Alphaproteobacteria bacterium SO-S41]|nr:HTH-type transcriptional regulator BetI [Alphaproteobacteria bacterium SO-S41]
MARLATVALEARKQPRQRRAQATVDAIMEATIQVLLEGGLQRLTTTRVAERAGVSVGTMYQYFPQKQALLFALLRRYMEKTAAAIAASCERSRGATIAVIAETLVGDFLDAKTTDMNVAQALHAVGMELATGNLLDEFGRANQAAIRGLLESAEDAVFDDPGAVAFALRATLSGTARAATRPDAKRYDTRALRHELQIMAAAYLKARARPRDAEAARR